MEYTLGLVLLDFVPVFAFLVGAYFLVKITFLISGKPSGRMMIAGTLLIFLGGFLKATSKLVYTLEIADLTLMGESQFVLLSFGYLAMLIPVIQIARSTNQNPASGSVIAIAVWKIPFLTVMTLCSLGVQGILSYISFQKNARLAGALFIVAVLCMLGMSGMASSLEQTIANQWIEESINAFGQISLALGSYLLYKVFKEENQPAPAGK